MQKNSLPCTRSYDIMRLVAQRHGEVSEWSKVLDSKSSVVMSHRGFESHPLCHWKIRLRGDFHEAFSVSIFGWKIRFGHILGTRDFKRGFWLAWNDGWNIKNEDAVQHPRFLLCITFAGFARGLWFPSQRTKSSFLSLVLCLFCRISMPTGLSISCYLHGQGGRGELPSFLQYHHFSCVPNPYTAQNPIDRRRSA